LLGYIRTKRAKPKGQAKEKNNYNPN